MAIVRSTDPLYGGSYQPFLDRDTAYGTRPCSNCGPKALGLGDELGSWLSSFVQHNAKLVQTIPVVGDKINAVFGGNPYSTPGGNGGSVQTIQYVPTPPAPPPATNPLAFLSSPVGMIAAAAVAYLVIKRR